MLLYFEHYDHGRQVVVCLVLGGVVSNIAPQYLMSWSSSAQGSSTYVHVQSCFLEAQDYTLCNVQIL